MDNTKLLVLASLITAGLLFIYWETKKNTTLINSLLVQIRELRAISYPRRNNINTQYNPPERNQNVAYAPHPEKNIVPGVEVTSGSLGHGHSIGVGLSLSLKIDKKSNRVFVISSDGELNEGSVWEAFMSASQFKLKNYYLIIDYNKMISLDKINNIMAIDPLINKMESFGFNVFEIDGHDFNNFEKCFGNNDFINSAKPKCIIANTIKGKSVPFMENVSKWHFRSPSDNEFNEAVSSIESFYERFI